MTTQMGKDEMFCFVQTTRNKKGKKQK